VASDEDERKAVQGRGGFVTSNTSTNDRARVQGRLVLTRSVGDVELDAVLSREPFAAALALDRRLHRFVIVASDGIWDAMSLSDAVHIVQSQMDLHRDFGLVEDVPRTLLHAEDVEAVPWVVRAAARMVLEAKARMTGTDNMMVGVIAV
jgi:serine/threonine protein phosphatase PrpC